MSCRRALTSLDTTLNKPTEQHDQQSSGHLRAETEQEQEQGIEEDKHDRRTSKGIKCEEASKDDASTTQQQGPHEYAYTEGHDLLQSVSWIVMREMQPVWLCKLCLTFNVMVGYGTWHA